MSVIRNFDDPIDEQIVMDNKLTQCFTCGKRLTFPFIMWFAPGGIIAFHPECAVDFHLAFARDIHELKPRVDKNSCEHIPIIFTLPDK